MRMEARISLLEIVIASLCANAMPRDKLDQLLETLTYPVAVDNAPDATKAIHESIDRFVRLLAERHGIDSSRHGKS